MAKDAISQAKNADSFASNDEILLGVLSAVETDSQISQRRISRDLGVALGLANAYLKRCVRKGWIKIQQVPRRRYAYYLTPQGFAEKSRLAGEYFSASFTFFRRARGQMSELMAECAARGWVNIAFAGVSDLAEIGVICALDFPVKIIAVIESSNAGPSFCGLPVKASVAECGPVDAIIVTDIASPEPTYRAIATQIDAERVLAPTLLRIALPKSVGAESSRRAAE
jgi:DNA-binding MarR family transcriptional regulator